MEPLAGYKLDGFPLPNLEHFSDLIYFEGPLLVHYIEPSNQHNYFYQWADTDDLLNRWLVYKVERQKVVDYVKGVETLKDILLSASSEFIIVVDIDNNNNHRDVQLVHLEALPRDYFAAEESYYDLTIPKAYNDWVNDTRTNVPDYLATFYDTLRSDAIYMNVAPSDRRHGTTMAVPEIINFLKNFNEAFVNFGVVDFEKQFSDADISVSRKSKIIKQLKKVNTLRAADVGIGSFGVALVPDFISAMGDTDPVIQGWLRTLISRFKRLVVDVDFNNPTQVQQLEQDYTIEQRQSFLKPYVKILENPNYSVSSADKQFKPVKTSKINASVAEKLIESPQNLVEDIPQQVRSVEEREVITLVVEKSKNQDISKMTGKQIASGTLFSQQTNQFPVQLSEVEFRGKKIQLRNPIALIANKVGERYVIDDVDFGISADGETAESALTLLKERIFRTYQRLVDMRAELRSPEQQAELDKFRGYLQVS